MFKAVTPLIMQSIEENTYGLYGYTEAILMEQAGILGWHRVIELFGADIPDGGRILFVAGGGNNGGDAMVMARRAHFMGYQAEVLLATDKLGTLAHMHKEICYKLDIPLIQWEPGVFIPDTYSMVIDGLVGNGLQGALRSPYDALVEELNTLRGLKVAIDVPSGIATSGSWFIADATLAMGLVKELLYLPNARGGCGHIELIELDFPHPVIHQFWQPHGTTVLSLDDLGTQPYVLPELQLDAYKNTRGHVGIFGGSPGLLGAPKLAALSASQSPVGRVTIFADDQVFPLLQKEQNHEVIRTVEDYLGYGVADRKAIHAVVVGPGWGRGADRATFLTRLVQSQKRGVIDADGIHYLKEAFYQGELTSQDTAGNWIITPHVGEFVELSGVSKAELFDDPRPHIRQVAEEFGVVVVLKSHVTWVATPEGRLSVVDGMNPSIGTAGSGDVLAGIIGSLLARGVDISVAAPLGVLIHQRAGKVLFDKSGWYNATDLAGAAFDKGLVKLMRLPRG